MKTLSFNDDAFSRIANLKIIIKVVFEFFDTTKFSTATIIPESTDFIFVSDRRRLLRPKRVQKAHSTKSTKVRRSNKILFSIWVQPKTFFLSQRKSELPN